MPGICILNSILHLPKIKGILNSVNLGTFSPQINGKIKGTLETQSSWLTTAPDPFHRCNDSMISPLWGPAFLPGCCQEQVPVSTLPGPCSLLSFQPLLLLLFSKKAFPFLFFQRCPFHFPAGICCIISSIAFGIWKQKLGRELHISLVLAFFPATNFPWTLIRKKKGEI